MKQYFRINTRGGRVRIGLAIAVLAATTVAAVGPSSATYVVDDDGVQCPAPDFSTIGAAVAAATSGDTIEVCAGTYAENVVLNKSLDLLGAQAGVDARGRSADESIITPSSGTVLTLKSGSADSTIDGFSLSGGGSAVETDGGPLDRIQLLNNRISGQTGFAQVYFDNSGEDITLQQNYVVGNGGYSLFFDGSDRFEGLQVVDNEVRDAGQGLVILIAGSRPRNVVPSASRDPLISGNLFENNDQAVNLDKRTFAGGAIVDNVFRDNSYDGLLGGPKDSLIAGNLFDGNGRRGIDFRSFPKPGKPVDPDDGPQNNMVLHNTFVDNGNAMADGAAIWFRDEGPAGAMGSNVVNENDITGNSTGVSYPGSETIDVTCNWWGSEGGPSGSDVSGSTFDYTPWLLQSFTVSTDCSGQLEQKAEGDKKFTDDDTGNPVEFKFKTEIKKHGAELKAEVEVKVKDHDGETAYKAKGVDSVSFDGNEVTFTGHGGGMSYEAHAVDNGEHGDGDTFEIWIWDSGHSMSDPNLHYSGTLTDGDVKIEPPK